MNDYSQPSFYHFTEDSISLARFASQYLAIENKHGVDLMSGSGVIGIELMKQRDVKVDLVEFQDDFKGHIEQNLEKNNIDANVLIQDFRSIETKYDFVLANPPYYFKESSRPAMDTKRDLCQRIEKQRYHLFINKVNSILKKNGQFFILSLSSRFEDFQSVFKSNVNEHKIHKNVSIFWGSKFYIEV